MIPDWLFWVTLGGVTGGFLLLFAVASWGQKR